MAPMTLRQLTETLERKDADAMVDFDFVYMRPNGKIHSYRGVYAYLALDYADEGEHQTVAQMVDVLKKANGGTFIGYKGGDFGMHDDTPMYVAHSNESGSTAIVDVVEVDGIVVLRTEKISIF